MLDTLRANRRNVLTALLFGIIIFVFIVSFGPGSQGCGAAAPGVRPAAKVNGEEISAADYEQQYGQLYRLYQQQAGAAFTNELAEQLGLRQTALEQVIQRALVLQEARKQGIVITDDELEREIKAMPSFQSGGRFDHDYYKRATQSAYGSESRFEQKLREDLLVQKTFALMRQTAKVSDEEVREAWQAEADRVNLELVKVPKDQRAQAEAALAALKAGKAPATAPVESGPFSAQAAGAVPRVGIAPELSAAAFAASTGDVLPKVFETPDGLVVARVKERAKPDAAKFDSQKAEYAERLRNRRMTQLEAAWVKSLRDGASIEVDPALAAAPQAQPAGQQATQ